MRDILCRNALVHNRRLKAYLVRNFFVIQFEHDDIISDAYERVLITIEKIEDRYRELKKLKIITFSEDVWIYSCLRVNVKSGALSRVNSPRIKRTSTFEAEYESKEDTKRIYSRPTPVVTLPEQEEVVFRKQLLEHCEALDPEERDFMRLAMDRATIKEITSELGITDRELMNRRSRAIRNLFKRAKGKAA